jgi:4-aminobutyrate aminotransferase
MERFHKISEFLKNSEIWLGEPNTEATGRILRRSLEAGLLMYRCGHWSQTIHLITALTVTRQQLDNGLEIFRQAILAE